MIPTLQLAQAGRGIEAGNASARPAFANVRLLLHMDGTNGARVYTDSSSYGRTISESGTNETSTTDKKFGTASLTFSTGSGQISAPDSSTLQLGASEWTFETWENLSAAGGGFSKTNEWSFEFVLDGGFRKVRIRLGTTGSGYSEDHTFPAASAHGFSLATWFHFAVERFGNTVTVYIDGVVIGSFAFSGTVSDTTAAMIIGRTPESANIPSGSYTDDLRLTIAEAVYQDAFAPPTAAHPNS